MSIQVIFNFIVIVMIILTCTGVSALIISEVELNPKGDDKRNEYIEFYSEEYVNLEDYEIYESSRKLDASGRFRGYFSFNFSGLNNKNEKIEVYKSGILVQTIELSDSENDERTWQYCEDWYFRDGTRDKENDCLPETIKLEPQSINTWKSKKERIKEYSFYTYALFIATVGVLIWLKKLEL